MDRMGGRGYFESVVPLDTRTNWLTFDMTVLNPTIDMQAFLPPKDDQKTWFVISRG